MNAFLSGLLIRDVFFFTDVKAMVSSYVGTRGLVFSQNLIHGIQKRRISQAISS